MDFVKEWLQAGQMTVSRLLLQHYHRLGLTTEELVFWLELNSYSQQGETFPDLDQIARQMGLSQAQVFKLLEQVVAKEVLQIVTAQDSQGRQTDSYDFSPLFEKLTTILQADAAQAEVTSKDDQVSHLYQIFEQEFGRPLSPLEYERIAGWLDEDHYDPELVRLALKEAVTHQARSLSYIDRILLNWESKNIKTKEAVTNEQARRKMALLQKEAEVSQGSGTAEDQQLPPITLHNPFKED